MMKQIRKISVAAALLASCYMIVSITMGSVNTHVVRAQDAMDTRIAASTIYTMTMWRPAELGQDPLPDYHNRGVANNEYRVMDNFYNLQIPAPVTQTVILDGDATAFTITQLTKGSYDPGTNTWIDSRHWPATFPAVYKGCHWSQCSRGSSFASGGPFPMRIWDFASLESYWEMDATPYSPSAGAGAAWNAAYDIWLDIGIRPYEWRNQFNGNGPYDNLPEAARAVTQPFGTEIMIWINYAGHNRVDRHNSLITPAGGIDDDSNPSTPNVPNYENVSIGGTTWDIWIGKGTNDHNSTIQWNMVSFVRTSPSDVFDVDTKVFIDYLLTNFSAACPIGYTASGLPINVAQDVHSGIQPCAASNWWIASVQAGFEVWANGEGLTTKSFSVEPEFTAGRLTAWNGPDRETAADDPLGQRIVFNWQDHIQIYKQDVVCATRPTAHYQITGDAFDIVDGQYVQLPGVNTVGHVNMSEVFHGDDGYDFYAVANPLVNSNIHGNAIVTVTVDCGGVATAYTQNVYINPSGKVSTLDGTPIADAESRQAYSQIAYNREIAAAFERGEWP